MVIGLVRIIEFNTERIFLIFALWKFSPKINSAMEWDSPSGRGFPGWHIECGGDMALLGLF